MSIIKKNATRSELIEIWRYGLGMSAEATDPVIEVIHRDEQDVGFLIGGRSCNSGQTKAEKQKSD